MFNLDDLIGKELKVAKKILKEKNEYKIEVIINSKHNEKCDTLLICKAERVDGIINLVCGEFYVDLKE